MTVSRGEIWLADLNPTQGSEQSGTRPVLIFQNNSINRFTSTFITIPLTTNLRRAPLPTCLLVRQGEGGLVKDSVALCHQFESVGRFEIEAPFGLSQRRCNDCHRKLRGIHDGNDIDSSPGDETWLRDGYHRRSLSGKPKAIVVGRCRTTFVRDPTRYWLMQKKSWAGRHLS